MLNKQIFMIDDVKACIPDELRGSLLSSTISVNIKSLLLKYLLLFNINIGINILSFGKTVEHIC